MFTNNNFVYSFIYIYNQTFSYNQMFAWICYVQIYIRNH